MGALHERRQRIEMERKRAVESKEEERKECCERDLQVPAQAEACCRDKSFRTMQLSG